MDNQYFIVAETRILAAYAISFLLVMGSLIWIYKQKLWLRDNTLNKNK